jgi:hypothetical protein
MFRFVAAYERHSLGIGSLWPFEFRDGFCPEHTTAISMLDRLLHHCHVIITDDDSCRTKHARAKWNNQDHKPLRKHPKVKTCNWPPAGTMIWPSDISFSSVSVNFSTGPPSGYAKAKATLLLEGVPVGDSVSGYYERGERESRVHARLPRQCKPSSRFGGSEDAAHSWPCFNTI